MEGLIPGPTPARSGPRRPWPTPSPQNRAVQNEGKPFFLDVFSRTSAGAESARRQAMRPAGAGGMKPAVKGEAGELKQQLAQLVGSSKGRDAAEVRLPPARRPAPRPRGRTPKPRRPPGGRARRGGLALRLAAACPRPPRRPRPGHGPGRSPVRRRGGLVRCPRGGRGGDATFGGRPPRVPSPPRLTRPVPPPPPDRCGGWCTARSSTT